MHKNNKKLKQSAPIIIKVIFIITLIALLFFAKDNFIIRIIFSCLFSLLSFLVEYMPLVRQKNAVENENGEKGVSKTKKVSIALTIIIVAIALVGNIIVANINITDGTVTTRSDSSVNANNNNDNPSSSQKTMYHQPKNYSLNAVTYDDNFDIFFTDSLQNDDLYTDLSYSLKNIPYRIEPGTEQLEGNNPYGNNALVANHYEELLNNEIDNSYAILEVTKTIFETALDVSEEMDKTYDTSNNRNRIIRIAELGYNHGLVDNTEKMQKKCIRYAWGLVYTEISYDDYHEDSLLLLIRLYKESSLDSRSTIMISVLSQIKDDFNCNKPHPVKNMK